MGERSGVRFKFRCEVYELTPFQASLYADILWRDFPLDRIHFSDVELRCDGDWYFPMVKTKKNKQITETFTPIDLESSVIIERLCL